MPPLNILAFDTSTDALSIALGRQLGTPQTKEWTHRGAGGAQSSSSLLPAILALMRDAGLGFGDLDAIAFGAGPGSFTGLRTACAVAQGLGYAADKLLLPVDSLMAVAEDARGQTLQEPGCTFVAMLDARMDEMYVAHMVFDGRAWQTRSAHALVKPEDLTLPAHAVLAGNVFAPYGARLPHAATGMPQITALPCAQAMLRLAPALMAAGLAVPAAAALPVYVRNKVAQTTQEREALRAAASVRP